MAVTLYPGGDQPVTPNFGLALWDVSYQVAENFLIIDANLGGGGGAVTSVFGRTGAVVKQPRDYAGVPVFADFSTTAGAGLFLDDATKVTDGFLLQDNLGTATISGGASVGGIVIFAPSTDVAEIEGGSCQLSLGSSGANTFVLQNGGSIIISGSALNALSLAASGGINLQSNTNVNSTLTDGASSVGTNGQILSSTSTGVKWIAAGGAGTVTSVGETFTGGLITVTGSPITSSGTFALTVAGTSGGIPYFSGSAAWASSAALPAGDFVLGGGAGSAPTASFSVVPIANGGTATGATLTGVVRGGNPFTASEISGDATTSSSNVLTLATVNGNVGSFTNANITVNAKGLVTAVANGTAGSAEHVQSMSTSTAISFSTAFNVFVKATAGAGGITATLPTAVGIAGQIARIMQVDTGAGGVIIATTSAQTLNGGASGSLTLTNQYQCICFESDGANWFIVATAN